MKIRLGVLFGGMSVEHEVSIITALQAIKNIDKSNYNTDELKKCFDLIKD